MMIGGNIGSTWEVPSPSPDVVLRAGPASISPVTVPPGAPGLWPASQARWHHGRPLAFPGVNPQLRPGMEPSPSHLGAKLGLAAADVQVGHGGQGPPLAGAAAPVTMVLAASVANEEPLAPALRKSTLTRPGSSVLPLPLPLPLPR